MSGLKPCPVLCNIVARPNGLIDNLCALCPNRRAPKADEAVNHDISVGEMLDESDEQAIGLLGRDPEVQFVRLAAAYNELKAKHQQAVNDALEKAAKAIEDKWDGDWLYVEDAAAIVRGCKDG